MMKKIGAVHASTAPEVINRMGIIDLARSNDSIIRKKNNRLTIIGK